MRYLIITTLLWAFSYSLIGEVLANSVDSYFAVLSRIVASGLIFVPLIKWKESSFYFIFSMLSIGALQFGITYICLYLSFHFLNVPEVLLFTIFTPMYVTLIEDALNSQFNSRALIAALIAILGAFIIRYKHLSHHVLIGFFILQIANSAFAAGQISYKHLIAKYPSPLPEYRRFGYFYLGALTIALPAFLLLGDTSKLPKTPVQWIVLAWLGFMASGLGFYLWNKGATIVRAEVLAVMNNAIIPVGIFINFVLWKKNFNPYLLTIGGIIILISLFIAQNTTSCEKPVLKTKNKVSDT
ncbi:UNVERIFIED_CONTAM: hypothetical protein GTU68_008600 [Idotea baltica]|nr:hypothetical protein [Idotea baltica]